MSNSPVDIVLQTSLHKVAHAIEQGTPSNFLVPGMSPEASRRTAMSDAGMTDLARGLLCRISHDANLPAVLRALAAAGGPGDLPRLRSMLEGTLAQRALEAAPAAAPVSTPIPMPPAAPTPPPGEVA
jgi:hypothetical protein